MKRLSWIFLLLVMVTISCNNASQGKEADGSSPAQEIKDGKLLRGKVVGISDGDTFKLLVEGNQTLRVRLHGVDAPEKAQDFGTQARQKLSELIFSKEVEVEKKNTDRYGRVIGIVYVDGLNVNEELLRSGMVWHYKEYDKNRRWAQLEVEARENQAGLWRMPNPTAPWQWRKKKREKTKVEEQEL